MWMRFTNDFFPHGQFRLSGSSTFCLLLIKGGNVVYVVLFWHNPPIVNDGSECFTNERIGEVITWQLNEGPPSAILSIFLGTACPDKMLVNASCTSASKGSGSRLPPWKKVWKKYKMQTLYHQCTTYLTHQVKLVDRLFYCQLQSPILIGSSVPVS